MSIASTSNGCCRQSQCCRSQQCIAAGRPQCRGSIASPRHHCCRVSNLPPLLAAEIVIAVGSITPGSICLGLRTQTRRARRPGRAERAARQHPPSQTGSGVTGVGGVCCSREGAGVVLLGIGGTKFVRTEETRQQYIGVGPGGWNSIFAKNWVLGTEVKRDCSYNNFTKHRNCVRACGVLVTG